LIRDWFRRLLRRPAKVEAGLTSPPTLEYVVDDRGDLVPVYQNWPGEAMMSRSDAIAWLDANAFGWRRFGEPPGHMIDGKAMYAESDLVRWLQDE
jgi:hypothetical protein